MARPSVSSAEGAQRVLGYTQGCRVDTLITHALVDVELEGCEAARIERVDGGVVAVGDVVHLLQIADHLGGAEKALAVFTGAGPWRMARRVAEAGHARNRIAQLRRQIIGITLADENDRLAALAQRAHVRHERSQRRERHLVAHPLDDDGRVVGVLLLELVPAACSRTCGRRICSTARASAS